MTALDDDCPTLLLFGDGETMLDALVAALRGRAITTVETGAGSAVAAVLANAPDLTVFVGRAAEPERAAALLKELSEHPLTSASPVALLAPDDSLDARLRAAAHGVLTIVPRSASATAMAERIVELATRLYEDPGVHEAGELAEASVADLVQILGRELQSGILSVSQEDGQRAERFVVRAGQPMREAITEFIERVKPLVADAKPLHYAFHEAPLAPLLSFDDDEVDVSVRAGLAERRFLLIANNPAHADALAQELRANGALVVVVAVDGSGWDRARDLDPEIALIDEDGLNDWGFDAVARLRADPQLRWASLVVMDSRELLPQDGPPRVERLAANVLRATESDRALRERAERREVFDARLETVGPTRLLRALLASGDAWNLSVRSKGGATLKVALAEGLVAGANAELADETKLEGPAAFACLLVSGAGRLRAEPATHPSLANMLMPLDEAVRAAHAEGSRVPVSHTPSAPPPPMPKGQRSASGGRGRLPAPSTETNALVGQLHDLVGNLQQKLGERASERPAAGTASSPPAVPPPAAPTLGAAKTQAALGAPRPAARHEPLPLPKARAKPGTATTSSGSAPTQAAAAATKPAAAPPTSASSAATPANRPIPAATPKPASAAKPGPVGPTGSAGAAPPKGAPEAPTPTRAAGGDAAKAPPPSPVGAAPAPSSPALGGSNAKAPPPRPAASVVRAPAVKVTSSAGRPGAAAAHEPPAAPPAPPAVPAVAAAPPALPAVPAVAAAPAAPPAVPGVPPAPPAAAASPEPVDASTPTTRPPPPKAAGEAPPPPSGRARSLPPPPPSPPEASAGPTTRPPPPAAAVALASSARRSSAPPPPPPARAPVPMPQRAPTAGAPPAPPPAALAQATPTSQPLHAVEPAPGAPSSPGLRVSRWLIVAGVTLAGALGFALVFFLVSGRGQDDAARVTPTPEVAPRAAVGASGDGPGTEAALGHEVTPPAPSAQNGAAPSADRASAPHAPRLPSVDPGPMPHEHAGAAATVDRYRQALARGSRTRERGDLEDALQSYRFALHLKPRSEDAALGMARTYLDAEQPADALRWAERARDLAERGIEGRLLMGDAHLRLGHYEQAIATWREAQALAPRERAPSERIRRAEEERAEAGD